MNPSTKKTLIIVLIVLLVFCLCAAAAALLGGFVIFRDKLNPKNSSQMPTGQPAAAATATSVPQTDPEAAEDKISASMDEI